MCIQVFDMNIHFSSLKSYGKHTLNFTRDSQTIFQSSLSILHAQRQCMRVGFVSKKKKRLIRKKMTKKLYPDCFRTGDTKLLLKIEFPSLIRRILLYNSSLICSEDNPLCSKKMVLKESHYLERHLWREENSRYLTKSWFSEKTVG